MIKLEKKDIGGLIGLSVVLIVFFVMCCLRATYSALWYDEAVEYWISQGWVGSVPGSRQGMNMYQHIVGTFQPPLYNVLMNLWLKVFDFEFGYRLAGIVVTLIGAKGIYFGVNEATDQRYAVIATLLYVGTWPITYYALECAEYNLMLAAIAWMLCFFIKSVKEPSVKNLVGFFIAACVACYSQYGAAFIVVALYLVLLAGIIIKKESAGLKRMMVCTLVTIVVAVLPLLYFFLIPQMTNQGSSGADHSIYFANGGFFKDFGVSLYKVFDGLFAMGIPGLCMLAMLVVALVVAIKGDSVVSSLMAALGITWLLYYFSVAISLYAYNACDPDKVGTMNVGGRYCLFFVPIVVVSAVTGLAKVNKLQLMIMVVAALVALGTFAYDARSLMTMLPKDDVREATAAWYENGASDSITFVHQEADANFQYYLTHDDRYDEAYQSNIITADMWIRDASGAALEAGIREAGLLKLDEFYYMSLGGGTAEDFIAVMEDLGYRAENCHWGRSALIKFYRNI